MRKLFILLFFSLIFVSCKNNVVSNIPEYIPDIQWSMKINRGILGAMICEVSDDNLYFYESKIIDGCSLYRLVCVDLNLRSYKWQSEFYSKLCEDKILLTDNYVFIDTETSLECYDKESGKLYCSLVFGNNPEEINKNRPYNCTTINYKENYLLWSTWNDNKINDEGIVRINISNIDFKSMNKETLVVNPELVWIGIDIDDQDEHVYTWPIIKDGVIYFQTYRSWNNYKSKFVAVDIESGSVKWIYESEEMLGKGCNALFVQNDRLYSMEYEIGCYDLSTGKPIWEHHQTEDDLRKEICLGGLIYNYAGIFFYDNCIYYTTNEGSSTAATFGCDESLCTNIKCINATTGKHIWSYMPKDCGSLSTRPIVVDNKVFVLTMFDGLWVFNRKSGKVLGCDLNVMSGGMDNNAVWNGQVIYFDNNILTVIKP